MLRKIIIKFLHEIFLTGWKAGLFFDFFKKILIELWLFLGLDIFRVDLLAKNLKMWSLLKFKKSIDSDGQSVL